MNYDKLYTNILFYFLEHNNDIAELSDSPSSHTISRSSTVENDMVFSRSVNI